MSICQVIFGKVLSDGAEMIKIIALMYSHSNEAMNSKYVDLIKALIIHQQRFTLSGVYD